MSYYLYYIALHVSMLGSYNHKPNLKVVWISEAQEVRMLINFGLTADRKIHVKSPSKHFLIMCASNIVY